MPSNLSAPPLVSVVIPLFRPHPRYFPEAVESVLAQTFRDFELIIVEDPSDESGADLLKGFDDDRVVHIRNSERTSLPEQHNLGVSMARGRFVCRFDADDICVPQRIQTQLTFLGERPDVSVVGSNLTIIDESGTVIGSRRYPLVHEAIVKAMQRTNPVANSTVMFRRSVYDQFGGWREGSPRPAQDYEWYSRLASSGVRFANIEEPLVRYRLHPHSIKSSKLRGTILTTLEVKSMYWRQGMDFNSRLIMLGERLLLFLPERLVLEMFKWLRYERR